MNGYLGEIPVDINEHEEFKTYTANDWAMLYIEQYGGIEGGHHRAWVLDQVAMILKGGSVQVVEDRWESGESNYRYSVSPSKEYALWVKEIEDSGYEYDHGIAP